VGLPLGLAFATRGKKVVLYDIDAEAVGRVNRGEMPFLDAGAEEALAATIGTSLSASTHPESISFSDAIVAVTGTPVDPHLNPDLTGMVGLVEELHRYLRDDQLFVLRSTVYPGVTEYVAEQLRQRGKSPLVAFCPERVAEGKALQEIISLPQIVAGVTPEASARARALFSLVTGSIIELKPREAELAKLFTNSWRYINFAVANQFYVLATQFDLDFYRIYEAMTKDYPRMQGFPRPGFTAGPCLFKDTMQLAAFSNNNFFLGHSAMLVNEGLPNYVVSKLKERYPLAEMTVGIAGMAFKADSDDSRDSLSYKLRKVLRLEAKRVLCSDPFIQDPSFVPIERLVAESDLVIVGTPHAQYRQLDIGDRKLVDVWNFFGRGGAI
jgi:UDP-N-acetyl-D-mannosaminuronic acid dehydrogenase